MRLPKHCVFIKELSKLFILIFLIGVGVTALAKEFKKAHSFKAGDVLSADILNEIFTQLEKLRKPIKISELEGSWICTKYLASTGGYSEMLAHWERVSLTSYWYTVTINLTIAANDNSTASWSSTGFNAFTIGAVTWDNCDGNGTIETFNNKFVITSNSCPGSGGIPTSNSSYSFTLTRVSGTRIELSSNSDYTNGMHLYCDKDNIPPIGPTNLSATLLEKTVTISWTDESDDETGFKILRRDELTGSYITIDTVSANVTSYGETLSEVGTYWYRIKAINSNGESIGSNVVKIQITN